MSSQKEVPSVDETGRGLLARESGGKPGPNGGLGSQSSHDPAAPNHP